MINESQRIKIADAILCIRFVFEKHHNLVIMGQDIADYGVFLKN